MGKRQGRKTPQAHSSLSGVGFTGGLYQGCRKTRARNFVAGYLRKNRQSKRTIHRTYWLGRAKSTNTADFNGAPGISEKSGSLPHPRNASKTGGGRPAKNGKYP